MGIQQQKYYKILLLGDSCIDKYHFGSCERLSQEAPVPVFKKISTHTNPGMAANVKANLESFDIHVDFISHGKDSIVKERFIDKRTKQHLLRSDSGENKKLQPIKLEKTKTELYDAIVISDYDKGSITCDNISSLLEEANLKNIPIFVDSKKTDLHFYDNCIIKINEKEDLHVEKYPKTFDLIVTLGSFGARYDNNIIPAEPTEVFDICGAGDTFFAGLIHKYLKCRDLYNSIVYANLCAAITVSKIGSYYLSNDEIKEVEKRFVTKTKT